VLLLLGRSKAKGEPVIAAVRAISPSTVVKFVTTDVASLSSVRRAAEVILSDPDVPRLDALILNAGVMMTPFELTADGVELQLASSHLGHWLLTNLLLSRLVAAGPGARIVAVASSGNKMGGMRWDDPNFSEPGSYDPVSAYGQAKTAETLAMVALNRRLQARYGAKAPRAYSLHPGSIRTGLQINMTPEMVLTATRRVYGHDRQKYRPGSKTLQQGCATTLRAALDPELAKEKGVFLDDCQLVTPETADTIGSHALDPKDAETLWTLSEKMVGEKFEI
jgi:NAD(P)-dependent dehydrogenase (short-subunit alcohol dehydrogenase family)